MKKINIISILALSFVLITGCDSGFDALNKNKVNPTSIDPAFTLNNAIINASAPGGILQYDLGIIQQVISSNSGVITGANFNQVNNDNAAANWVNYYRNVIKYTADVLATTKTIVPARPNLNAMARIIQAYAYMILTDTYGDIPYTEGGAGYTTSNFFPKYETQSSIYPKLIQELTDATAALDGLAKIESADVLYGGDVVKWKKFGNSLLLRAGMRLVDVDATLAKNTVLAAVNSGNGFILVNADNAVVKHDANYVNAVGNTLNSTEAANYYLTEPFVNVLKANNDPRLTAIAIRYVGATSGPGQILSSSSGAGNGDITLVNQVGMPMGKDDATAQAAAVGLGIGSRYAFTQVDRQRMASKLAPNFWVTAAQTNFLLAEATTRTYIATGTTDATYFDTGIKQACDQLAAYNANANSFIGNSTVSPANRDAYAASRVAPFGAAKLQEINYEYWVASFLNGNETWANYRRSGFPVLAPNPYPGAQVTFITRLVYPVSENLVNNKNYKDAVAGMGSDRLDVKVWWDK